MKEQLITKLMEIGYTLQYINERINGWLDFSELLENVREKTEIELFIYNAPTYEIPRVFLNIDDSIKNVLVFDGSIQKILQIIKNIGNVELAEYELDKPLCLIAITNENKIKILRYFSNSLTYKEKTYEQNIMIEREQAINDYLVALTQSGRLEKRKIEEILQVLTQEYIIDKIIIENLNPRIHIEDDAKKFADSITNYNYKYIDKIKNIVKEIKKEIRVKILGRGVSIGNMSNNPYLPIYEVNQNANFYLDKPSYAWLSRNLKGREELIIYVANAIYSAKTYNEWLETRIDNELMEKAEKLSLSFSKQLGYSVAKEYLLEVLKKLNKDMIVVPIDFIKNNMIESSEQIDVPSYQFSIVNSPDEFEKELYIKIENYFAGTYRCQRIETLKDNYTLVGKKIAYTDMIGKRVEEQVEANFGVNINTAIIKNVTLVTSEYFKYIEEDNWNMLPLPTSEVIFYMPDINNLNIPRDVNKTKFYRELDAYELDKKTTKVSVSFVTKEGDKIKENEEMPAWIGEYFTPEIDYKIIDKNGLMWEYAEMKVPTILVEENEKNEIVLVYDKLKRKVRINFVDENGNSIKGSKEELYQVGEKIRYIDEETYTDSFGGRWRAKTLDKLNQKVFEDENKNVINLIYEEEMIEIVLSFTNELGQRVMNDKTEKFQIGSTFKYSISKEIIDVSGKYWVCVEEPEEFKVEAGKEYKILLKCKPLITHVKVEYVNEDGIEILPQLDDVVQVGTIYSPKMLEEWQSEDGRHWVVATNQTKEFKIKKNEMENMLKIKYEPVLVKVTIRYLNSNGEEIKRNDIVSAQLGSKWVLNPKTLIKDDKGNEWQLLEQGYKPITIKENEKENVMEFIYQVAMTTVSINYMTQDGDLLKPEDQILKQIGSAFIPTPEQYIIDNANRRWQLKRVQPAMLRVKTSDNSIIITYQPDNCNVTWQYLDTNGNQIRSDEIHLAQVGEKYTPIVKDTVIKHNGETYKLLNINPYELIISENSDENIVRLIYIKTME